MRAGCLAVALAAARLGATDGVVFEDLGAGGPRGGGLPGVAVSNGVDVALTDAGGRYHLPDRPGSRVFVVKPRGWRPLVDADNKPLFHSESGARTADFALVRTEEPDRLRALVLTDPQPSSDAEVGYLGRGLVGRLGKRPDLALGVVLGDIVYDHPELFPKVSAQLARVGIPMYSLPGNHDLSLGAPDEPSAVAAFEAVDGPSTFAFHAGPALFIALDDVRPLGGPRFIGGLREDQFAFLSNLLAASPSDAWTVVMVHIPFFQPYPIGPETFRRADRLRLFSLLKDRPHVLVLSGHTHYQRHVTYGPADGWMGAQPLHDYNVAAACGGFWGGPRNADGIPVSTMWDGTPPGYAILGFKGDDVSLDYYPALLDPDHQMAIHVPKTLAPHLGYVSFYANVFNGDDDWSVQARVDDRAWNAMTRTLGWDPSFAEAFLAQDAGGQPLPGPRLPDPVVCYHLWRGILPADLAVGKHVIQVRASGPGGKTFTSSGTVEIELPDSR
jgi:3',5'-cyclic AMP phosphodiesterase CpdA